MANKTLARNLRKAREARELTQAQVAEALGVPTPTYSSWERGRTDVGTEWLTKIADLLGVPSVDSLLRSEKTLVIGSLLKAQKDDLFHAADDRGSRGFYTLIYRLIMNRLFFYDIHERRMQVELAESWRTDRPKFSYTFYIRDRVTFHDGSPLEVEDVEYSYKRHLEKHVFHSKCIHSITFNPTDRSMKLKLNRWLELHELPTPQILPRSSSDKDIAPFGTGPFRLTKKCRRELEKGLVDTFSLEANKEYFSGSPHIRNIEVRGLGSAEALENALKEMEIDVGVDIAIEKPEDFDMEVSYGIGDLSYYLVMKGDNDICKDPSLREAVDYSLKRKELINVMKKELGIGVNFLPDNHLYNYLAPSTEGIDRHEPENAQTALKRVKASPEKLTFKVARVSKREGLYPQALLNEILEQLKRAGINAVQSEPEDAHALLSTVNFNTAEFIYDNLTGKNAISVWKYDNPHVSNLLEGEYEEVEEVEDDGEVRKCKAGVSMDTYREIQRILLSEHVFIPIFRRGVPVTYTKDLNTKYRLRPTTKSLLYGPDVAHWELEEQA